MKKQTAIQWLFLMLNNPNRDQEFANKLLEKALEMEKEEIESAYKEGYDMGYDHGFHEDEPDEEGEKFYYTQTYKSE